MAKCVAHRKGNNTSDSISISFTKDLETGLYRKVEKDIRTNYKEHKTKMIGKPRISDELYELSNKDDFEYSYQVSTPAGEMVYVYFKRALSSGNV